MPCTYTHTHESTHTYGTAQTGVFELGAADNASSVDLCAPVRVTLSFILMTVCVYVIVHACATNLCVHTLEMTAQICMCVCVCADRQ